MVKVIIYLKQVYAVNGKSFVCVRAYLFKHTYQIV